jgi:hypothetical protein
MLSPTTCCRDEDCSKRGAEVLQSAGNRPSGGIGPLDTPCTVAASKLENVGATPSNSEQLRATPSNSEQLRATPSNSEQRSADQPFHPLRFPSPYPLFPDGLFHVLPPEVGTATPARLEVIPDFLHVAASPTPQFQRVRLSPPSPHRRWPDAQPFNMFLRCTVTPQRQNPCRVLVDHAFPPAAFAPHPSIAGRLRFTAVLAPPCLPAAEPVAPPSRQVTHAVLHALHRLATSGEQVSPFSGDVAVLHGERRFSIPLGSHVLFFSSSLSKKNPSLPVQSSHFPDTSPPLGYTWSFPPLYALPPKILREIF